MGIDISGIYNCSVNGGLTGIYIRYTKCYCRNNGDLSKLLRKLLSIGTKIVG